MVGFGPLGLARRLGDGEAEFFESCGHQIVFDGGEDVGWLESSARRWEGGEEVHVVFWGVGVFRVGLRVGVGDGC